MQDDAELAQLSQVDSAIVAAAKQIKVLSRLSWPVDVMETFLAGWSRGEPRLPVVEHAPCDLGDVRRQLEAGLAALAVVQGPMATYLAATASSYAVLCELLEAVGSPRVTAVSRRLYGAPADLVSGGHVSNLEAARHFLLVGSEYFRASGLREGDYCLPAEAVRSRMLPRLDEVFEPGTIRIEIDPSLASKAAAGATRVRLRGATCFSEFDVEQLLQHEAFVHGLTALNGRAQPWFKSLSLGAPRTTGPQEGLATFSELVTGAIDISRLERIALRVVAIEEALNGADFVEVFRGLLEAGQTPEESFNATMRVFRGVPLTGGCAFTKDVVYLRGLMEVHTFFRWAMQHQRLGLARQFFAGRMTIGDVVRLDPLFQSGTLVPPRYLPPWMVRTNGLAGYLAFSVFASRVTVAELDEYHDFDAVEDLGM